MAILVYKLTCSVSGKSYVGITARALDTRWLEHCARARQGIRNSRLCDAMRKYGMDAFSREVIATADTEDEARSLETHFIKTLQTYENGYNANEGGHGHLHFPEHIKEKIRASNLGKKRSSETRAKMSAAKLGKPECAGNFGAHTQKGSNNPRAASWIMKFPDGSENTITGLRAFCRATGAHIRHLKDRGHSKGYVLIKRLADGLPSSTLNGKEF